MFECAFENKCVHVLCGGWESGRVREVGGQGSGINTLTFSRDTSHSNLAESFSLTSTSWSGLENSTCGAVRRNIYYILSKTLLANSVHLQYLFLLNHHFTYVQHSGKQRF